MAASLLAEVKVGRQEVSLGLVTGVTVKLGVGDSRQRLGPVGEPCVVMRR